MQRKTLFFTGVAFVCMWCPAITLADEPTAAPPPSASTGAEEQALGDADLLILRGGQALVIANQTLTAINSGGVLNGDYTAGAISFSDNALANFNGFGNVVVNTGAQNNLQSGLNVTINIGN
jgi:hypothetical protein